MISLIVNFLIQISILTNRKDFEKNEESIYSIFATSILIAVCTNGIFGLLFAFLKLTFLPLSLFLLIILSMILSRIYFRRNFLNFFKEFFKEFKNFQDISNDQNYIKIVFAILILLFVVSIGPINHSDTANVYVGYPYKFWMNNKHFIDGNLNQGLLGIGDFANLFYIQERTSWLIRSTQYIPIIPIVMLLIKRKTNKILVFIFLTSPVFMQWLTIGKTNFLSESCLAIVFLVWEKYKEKRDLIFLISLSIIAISFKISALLICFPIYIYLAVIYKNKIYYGFPKIISHVFCNGPTIVAIFSLSCILFYRYYCHSNPFYPLLSNVFTSNNQQLIDWENLLKEYGRSSIFHLGIFIPQSIGKISFVLGPANLILFLYSFFILINYSVYKIKTNFIIGISQFLMLILFAQGRADYYISPLLLTYVGMESIDLTTYKRINKTFKNIIFSSLIIQLGMFLISAIYMIYITSFIILDYENGMNKFAWNFYNSKVISNKAKTPIFNEILGMTHLYFKGEFIANDKFNSCYYYGEKNNKINTYYSCAKKLGVETIIVEKGKLSDNKKFICKTEKLMRVSRNIFLTRKKEVDFCNFN